jgi:hypothetical protein
MEVNFTEFSQILPMNVRGIFRGSSMNEMRKGIILKNIIIKYKKNSSSMKAVHETL